MLTERELQYLESLRHRIRVMDAQGYSEEAIYANISLQESRLLSPEAQMNWRRLRKINQQSGRLFALRNNPEITGISLNLG